MIRSLTKEQYEYVLCYLDLLEAVEEGFNHAEQCYEERNFGLADDLIDRTTIAMASINACHSTLASIFNEKPFINQQLTEYGAVSNELIKLSNQFPNDDVRINFIRQKLIPSYVNWKSNMIRLLNVTSNQIH